MITLNEKKNKADIINSFTHLLLTLFPQHEQPPPLWGRGDADLNSELSSESIVPFTYNRNFVIFLFQGTNASALEKDIGPEQFPINEHYFGLVNVSI